MVYRTWECRFVWDRYEVNWVGRMVRSTTDFLKWWAWGRPKMCCVAFPTLFAVWFCCKPYLFSASSLWCLYILIEGIDDPADHRFSCSSISNMIKPRVFLAKVEFCSLVKRVLNEFNKRIGQKSVVIIFNILWSTSCKRGLTINTNLYE